MSVEIVSEREPQSARLCVAGRYRLVERLAQGGMGEVYVAEELASGRRVALKRLLHAARKRQALFRAEYHALARLQHPYIIEVYDFGVDEDDLPYYTMELLDGHDLREHPPVGVREACRYLRDIACSLALLHAQRLIHRDVSPRNVRITNAGVCKLFDFGTMVPFGVPSTVAGTPPFVSPEAWEGAHLDQRADIYSLGALAYWLLSRRLPGPTRHIEQGAGPRELPPELCRVAPDVPAELSDLVMSMLELEPGKRPWSVTEVITRVNAVSGLASDDSIQLAHSYLGSSRLVGRKRELAKVSRCLSRALRWSGSALLIEGFSGAGKSRFLDELAVLGQTHGFSVVRGYGVRGSTYARLAHELYAGLRRAAPTVYDQLAASDRAALDDFRIEDDDSQREMSEARAALQSALSAYVRSATKSAPWLFLVDDLDLADEFSCAFIASLSRVTHTRPLLVVASGSLAPRDALSGSFLAYAEGARRVPLHELSHELTYALVTEVFGAVPNRERLVEWLYREAHGNPGLTMELGSWLLRRGTIRYRDGAFVLPDGDILDVVPRGTAIALGLRLSGISDGARRLAELIACCRGGVSLELCLAAADAGTDEVLSAIEELVRQGVLVWAGSGYVFKQEVLRTAVREAMDVSTAKARHERLARALLLQSHPEPAAQLEAGWHLVHTDDELRGAELLAEVAPPFIASGVAYQAAIGALEKALEVLERRQGSLETRLFIRTLLARAAYLYDYRLALRYGEETLRALYAWTGMDIVRPWQRWIGGSLSLLGSLLIMLVRRWRAPPQRRGPRPRDGLQWLVRASLALIGVRVTALDGAGARALLERIGLFAKAPSFSTARTVYLAAAAASAQPGCGEAEMERVLNEALRRMQVHRLRQMKPHEKENLRTALMLARGITECYRLGSDALAHADALEAQGTNLARAAALRVRFTYYVVRGMRERAEQHRHELDILAIQGGTTWQVEWFAVPIEGVASARFGDVVGAGQALERLERLVDEVPSLKPLRDMVRMGYELCRGNPSAALALGEKFVTTYPPYGVIGWAPAYAVYAAALTQVGQPQAARDLCQRALAAMRPGDEEFSVMYGPLQQELATATAALGDLTAAQALADRYIQRLEEAREYALLAHVWAVRVRMARKIGEQIKLAESLVALRDAAERADSTTVLNQALRVTQASLRASAELERAHITASEPPSISSSSDFDSSDADTPARGLPRISRHVLLKRALNRADAHAIVVWMAADRDASPRVADAVGEPIDQALLAQVLAHTQRGTFSSDDDDPGLRAFEPVRVGPYFCEVVRLPLLRGHRHALVLVWRTSPEVGATGAFLAQYAKVLRRDQAAGESATRELSCANGASHNEE